MDTLDRTLEMFYIHMIKPTLIIGQYERGTNREGKQNSMYLPAIRS